MNIFGYKQIVRRNKTRQIKRGQKLSENDWIETSLINRQIEFFSKLCIPANRDKIHLIDTNYMTEQDVLESVYQLLKLEDREMERDDD